MYPKLTLLILALGLAVCLSAVATKTYDYESTWKQIEKLRYDGLPKSLGAKVDSLYEVAVKENRTDQQVKALVYQLMVLQQVEEFSAQKAILKVQSAMKTSSFPASAILHSMLGEMYFGYYQSNRWRFSQRTETIQFQQDDIATWDLKTITKNAIKEYQLSLQRPMELQKHSLKDFSVMLNAGGTEERLLRPTLYDLLAHRALDFYLNDESGLTLPFEEYSITDVKYFQPAASFAKMSISSPDSLSLKYQAALLFQDLIRFHLDDADPAALVEVDIDRLDFIYRKGQIANSEKYYETALRLLMDKYAAYPCSAYAKYKLASLYDSLSAKYNPELSEDYRWYLTKAVELCEEAIKAYPKSFGGMSCNALKSRITQLEQQITTEQFLQPQSTLKVLLSAKNLSFVTFKIYRIPYPSLKSRYYSPEAYWQEDSHKRVWALLKKTPLWLSTYPVTNEGDYRSHSYELALTCLPKGNYILIAANAEDKNQAESGLMGFTLFNCTELSYVMPNDRVGSMLIANRNTGLPVCDAQVMAFEQKRQRSNDDNWYQLRWSGKSNNQGIVDIDIANDGRDLRLILSSGADTLQIYNYYSYHNSSYHKTKQQCLLFTDRSIYRPGQTIYVKGVSYETDGEKYYKLLPDQAVEAVFYDTNGQRVASQKLKTNEYATFNCSFTAPQGVLTGNMTIRTSYGSIGFSVEEYKRPRFEVTIDKPKDTYKLNQYVTVKGKATAYAGFPIDNSNVSYRITRQPKYPYWYWWWGVYPSTSAKEIDHGTAVTDEKGEFSLSFLAVGDESVLQRYNPYFTFSISVDVTDVSGETRSGSLGISIGEKELILKPVLQDNIDSSTKQLTIPIMATNLNSEPVAVKGTVTVSRLQTPDNVQKTRLWSTPDRNYLKRDEFVKLFPTDIYAKEDKINTWKVLDKVFTGNFDTPAVDSLLISNLSKWQPGAYVLEATASYKQQEIKVTKYFKVYNSESQALPYPMADWYLPIKTVCEPGEDAKILLGSGYRDVSVLYEIEKNHKVVASERIALSNKQRLITIPVVEDDRGSFYVHFTFIRDGRLYTHSQEITVPWTNKQLSFEYMTFRNKLLPGQKEEWRLKLKDYTGGKATAELLASMYDASLDAFRSSSWAANVYGKVQRSCGWNNYAFSQLAGLMLFKSTGRYGSFPQRNYDRFNWYRFSPGSYGYGHGVKYDMPSMAKSAGSSREIDLKALSDEAVSSTAEIALIGRANEVNMTVDGMSVSDAIENGEQSNITDEPPSPDLSGVQARSNFAETAFFYPELKTDENGEVIISFTVPEALTRWKFRALAITKDLKIGTSENTTVTQKPMMVMPNAPRFFREGDKITFSSKISSLDDSDLSGTCQLFLFDALSMEPVDKSFGISKAQQPFSVKKGESTVLSWDLSIPFDISAVTYRVVAKAGDFSDGEESTLPILSNRMMVTESLPLPVSGNSTKSFVFSKLKDSGSSSTLKNHKLTLEYTSNPAWYAVQALPYMMEYPYECNEQIFSRLYANSLAGHIANSNPRIKKVFESWRDTPNSTALLSNLEKNQELKAVLLQETPWVMDAKNESQSKQRIGLLFDLNNMANQYDNALAMLQKGQKSNGGWPWFPGMDDSWWVTQYIVEGFGHLDKLGVKSVRDDNKVWNMIRSAVGYIDRRILEDYLEIKKYSHLEDDHLGYMEMHYLYARSFFPDIPIGKDTAVAVDYFMGQADKYWLDKQLFGQGLIALALHRSGNKITPKKIIASLKERALHNEELGMWWKNDAGWYWYQAPIETQALMIETFTDVAADTPVVDELRTWLLKQKQTTNWKTTKATAEACYALLLSGTEWLNTELLAEITIGGNKIDPMKLEGSKVEAGTGYFKTSWTGSDITPQMANVTVSNPNRVSSWGSLYWQYFENLDKISPAETPLKLNKKLFIERITVTGKVLDPVSDKTQLQIGDKVIVRIELRSDRDMEYVHMKDMRSAGFEPINVLSRTKWQDGLVYYEATGDAATNFFIEYLHKGTFVFEYPLRVTNKGDFSNGVTTIQCMYAPEFTSHSEGIRVNVK